MKKNILLIGLLSIIVSFFSECGSKRVDHNYESEFVIVNNLKSPVKLFLYEVPQTNPKETSLAPQDSVILKRSSMGVPASSPASSLADSVSLSFVNGKCLIYKSKDRDGIYDLKNYADVGYDKPWTPRVHYYITEKDYNKASKCK